VFKNGTTTFIKDPYKPTSGGAVMPGPRLFAGADDREKMRQVLVQGRQAENNSYYVHVGDLSWWLYYVKPGANLWQHIYLWDSPRSSEPLRGWALLSPDWSSFDVFIQPALRGSPQAWQIYDWAEEQAAKLARRQKVKEIRTMWVADRDDALIFHLERRGFKRSQNFMNQYMRWLEGPIVSPTLPEGFYVRRLSGEREAPARAAASHVAFESDMPMESYVQRYLAFMRSPVYRPELDIVAIAPDGSVAAFCQGWLDFTNRVGLFEPVGTHPNYRRLGLGKAILTEGMHRMVAYGMRTVIVCAEHDNPAAQSLYRTSGFQLERRLLTYVKQV
jgi:mycothiol synthase